MKEKDSKKCHITQLAGRSPEESGSTLKKMFFAVLLCGIVSFALTACDFPYARTADTGNTVAGDMDIFRELTCVSNSSITKKVVYDYTDPETGVHYLIYSEDQYHAGMGGITPRLNPDGSIMVEKRKRGIEQ